MRLTKEQREVVVANCLSVWGSDEQKDRAMLTIDGPMFTNLFKFIPVVSTIHDQNKNPIAVIVDRKEAIRLSEVHYGLRQGKQVKEELSSPEKNG